jgi:hypothetical protein
MAVLEINDAVLLHHSFLLATAQAICTQWPGGG